jgi:hypothetical protein
MRRRAITAAAAALLALGLVGCGDEAQQRHEAELRQIELGKACFDAGGEWDWNGWSGWLCEFGGDE